MLFLGESSPYTGTPRGLWVAGSWRTGKAAIILSQVKGSRDPTAHLNVQSLNPKTKSDSLEPSRQA